MSPVATWARALAGPCLLAVLVPMPALAEVCDKINPFWSPGEVPWPNPFALGLMVVAGMIGGLLGVYRKAWLLLPLAAIGFLVWAGDSEVLETARAEGCVPSNLALTIAFLGAAAAGALPVWMTVKRSGARRP